MDMGGDVILNIMKPHQYDYSVALGLDIVSSGYGRQVANEFGPKLRSHLIDFVTGKDYEDSPARPVPKGQKLVASLAEFPELFLCEILVEMDLSFEGKQAPKDGMDPIEILAEAGRRLLGVKEILSQKAKLELDRVGVRFLAHSLGQQKGIGRFRRNDPFEFGLQVLQGRQ